MIHEVMLSDGQTVYRGIDEATSKRMYALYIAHSKSGKGGFAGVSVFRFIDGNKVQEYIP